MIDKRDIEVAFQLFSCGIVWDGYLVSKCSRDRLVDAGYAVRWNGVQALTGKGSVALLLSWRAWRHALREWRCYKRNAFVVNAEYIRALLS